MDLLTGGETILDLATAPVREINAALHGMPDGAVVRVLHPQGAHNVAVGIGSLVSVEIEGHVGYYAAGMHQRGSVHVRGNAGPGVAENMMSGTVRIAGDASQSAGATAVGGLLVIDGSTGSRCGIALRGADIVVGGSVGHVTGFMAQAGRIVVCGDAGDALGDSLYEARIYVRGSVASLGTDCIEKPMRHEHLAELAELLAAAGRTERPEDFRRYGSARRLYHFRHDNEY